MGFFDILKTLLRRIPTLIDNFQNNLSSDDFSQLDPEKLKKYYREEFFVKSIVNISSSFIFAGGFNIKSEDKEAQKVLTDIWKIIWRNYNLQGEMPHYLEMLT